MTQNATKNNTETKHLPFLPHGFVHGRSKLLAAGVNYWFFLLAHLVVCVGIKQNTKCEMILYKIDSEINMQNHGFSAKLRNGDGGDMLHD